MFNLYTTSLKGLPASEHVEDGTSWHFVYYISEYLI